jgi:flagellar biosynthetic protein FliP
MLLGAPPSRKKILKVYLISALLLIGSATLAYAQSISIDMGQGGGSLTGKLFQFIILVTLISLAPSILLMVTSFTRLIVVFSFLRNALGMQNSPPTQVLVGLSLFLTAFIMAPTLEKAYDMGVKPLVEERISEGEAFEQMAKPFHEFMRSQVREKDVDLFMQIARLEQITAPEEIPLKVLVPAFMISELRRAFEIGFLLFLPFLIIDIVVASVLMSLGMMMLPPVMVSLPFKVIFFVLVDGWYLIVGSLTKGFG